jgi:hypothetical protein
LAFLDFERTFFLLVRLHGGDGREDYYPKREHN